MDNFIENESLNQKNLKKFESDLENILMKDPNIIIN